MMAAGWFEPGCTVDTPGNNARLCGIGAQECQQGAVPRRIH